jgi:hypothetical protein
LENYLLKGGSIVKNSDLRKMMIFAVSSIIIFSAMLVAAGEGLYKNQGAIAKIDLSKNTMLVNERIFVWNQNTAFYDNNSSPIGIHRFGPKSWVYIEGTIQRNNIILIEKLYLLPKYVEKKERHRYPFME